MILFYLFKSFLTGKEAEVKRFWIVLEGPDVLVWFYWKGSGFNGPAENRGFRFWLL